MNKKEREAAYRAMNSRQRIFAQVIIETIRRQDFGMTTDELAEAIAYAVAEATA